MSTCATCRFWDTDGRGDGSGFCDKINSESKDPRKDLAFCCGGGYFFTMPTFGCILYKEKKKPRKLIKVVTA